MADLQPGQRVEVVSQPNDPFEGTLRESRLQEVMPEAGGDDLLLYEWRVEKDSGESEWVPQAALKVVE